MKDEKQKKTLNWRLQELPTAGEVAELVDSEVITKDEAREILFSDVTSSDEKVKALEEQVEFLRDLVTELSKNRGFINAPVITRTITTPNVYWGKTTTILCNAGLNVSTGTAKGVNGTSGYTMSVSGGNTTASSGNTLNNVIS